MGDLYDFNSLLARRNTDCTKWDALMRDYGRDDLMPFWVADMDFPVLPEISEAIRNRAAPGQTFGYTFTGHSYLQSVIGWNLRRHDLRLTEEEILPVPGVVTAMAIILMALTQKGDRVVINPPVYPPFYQVVGRLGRELVPVPLVKKQRYELDFEALEREFRKGVQAYLFCSPHNPVGRVWTEQELMMLTALCRKYHVLMVSDEIHSDIVYTGSSHTTILKCMEEAIALTADDVVYTIKRATEMPSSAAIFAAFDGENTKAVDDLTVDVVTKEPFAAVLNYLASTRGGIVCKKAVEEMGDDTFGRAPVGTGPFMFDNWVTGTSITLKRNDNYWGDKPAYSTLTLKFITETANRALEIEAGNADIVLDPDTTDLDRIKSEDGIEVVTGDSYGISYIILTMDDPAFEDIRVRQALSLAIDMDSVVKSVYGDYATVAESVIPKTIFAYKSQGGHEYDVEKAKELLAEAGVSDLTLQMNLPSGSEQQNIGVIVQNMWQQIGVNAEISTASTSEVIAAGRWGDNQVTIMSGTYSTGDPGHALADFDTRSDGFFRPNDTKIDDYLDQGAATYDSDARAEIYAEAQDYIYHQYFMIPVASKTVNYLITDQVEGFYCDPGDIPSFANVVVYE